MQFYTAYTIGAEFPVESSADYVGSSTRFKKARDLINKEARFLFSTPPTFAVNPDKTGLTKTQIDQNTQLNNFLEKVLNKIQLDADLVKAAKDCFIGKRIACMLNFNETEGITASFLNSHEFLYEFRGKKLVKLVAIFIMNDTPNRADQIVKKKKYELGDDGYCYVEEALYDGLGNIKPEGTLDRTRTEFTRIPGVVIFNEGLCNDRKGTSDIESLIGYEALYSKLANSDVNSEDKNMNPIRYTLDASSESTSNLSVGPGAFWDLQTDQTGSDPKTAKVGVLETTMSYSEPLKTTLDRIETVMFSEVEVPNITSEKLQGVITSGKTLKALYWSLIVRCNEKMLVWGPALSYLAECIIEGAKLYPESAAATIEGEYELPDVEFEVKVENNYPLPEDEVEEKTMDLAEVAAQTMSKRTYMKKWRELTDDEAMEELKQIALERQLLEDSFTPDQGNSQPNTNEDDSGQNLEDNPDDSNQDNNNTNNLFEEEE